MYIFVAPIELAGPCLPPEVGDNIALISLCTRLDTLAKQYKLLLPFDNWV